jgi:hypothetical protein
MEARRIAANIAKLPELLRHQRPLNLRYTSYKKVPRGFRAAERRMHAALNKQDRLGRKIAATKALTVAGLAAKARCVAMEFPGGEVKDAFDDYRGIAVSIMHDLSALAA